MSVKTLLNSVLLLWGLSATVFAAPTEHDTRLQVMQKKIQEVLNNARKEHNFGAMSLTIIDKQTHAKPLTFHSGKTQKTGGRDIAKTDYYQIGSNTKSFIAALLIKLADEEDKLFSLQDSITTWLPEYEGWEDVKVINLIRNNSGIPCFSIQPEFATVFDTHGEFTPAELISYSFNIKDPQKKRLFKAGKGWNYSNTNWILAGMIAEKVTGKSLTDLLNNHFMFKIPLNQTLYWPTAYNDTILANMVHGYDNDGIDITTHNPSWAGAAGAMIATNEDLARWTYALFHGQVLNKKQLNKMQQLVSIKTGKLLGRNSEEDGYGTGIGKKTIKAGTYWGHEGHTEGYHSLFAYFPGTDITISMHANGLKDAQFQPVLNKVMKILRRPHCH